MVYKTYSNDTSSRASFFTRGHTSVNPFIFSISSTALPFLSFFSASFLHSLFPSLLDTVCSLLPFLLFSFYFTSLFPLHPCSCSLALHYTYSFPAPLLSPSTPSFLSSFLPTFFHHYHLLVFCRFLFWASPVDFRARRVPLLPLLRRAACEFVPHSTNHDPFIFFLFLLQLDNWIEYSFLSFSNNHNWFLCFVFAYLCREECSAPLFFLVGVAVFALLFLLSFEQQHQQQLRCGPKGCSKISILF